jgi:predicted RNA methylase
MRIPNEVLAVLDRCDTEGCRLTLPGQLERKDYVRVNTVLEAAGGKWDRRAKAHLFADPAGPIIESIMLTGEVVSRKQELQYFPTPPLVVGELLDRAELNPWHHVLEPSAGRGAIASAVAPYVAVVDCIEIDGANVNALRDLGLARAILTADFLTVPVDAAYDRVVMNPPFTRQQDIAHVTRALEWLKPDGLLVSVMALSVTFRQNKATADFRALVASRDGYIDALPDDAFKESGTGVKTVIVTIPGVAR